MIFLVLYDVQKGRPARPQGVRTPRRTRAGYVEEFERLRTTLAGFFNIVLARRPRHVAPAQNMEMKMKHALAAMYTSIDDEAVPGIGNPLLFCDRITGRHQMP